MGILNALVFKRIPEVIHLIVKMFFVLYLYLQIDQLPLEEIRWSEELKLSDMSFHISKEAFNRVFGHFILVLAFR